VAKIDELSQKRVATDDFNKVVNELKDKIELRNTDLQAEIKATHGTIDEAIKNMESELSQKIADAAKQMGETYIKNTNNGVEKPDEKIYGQEFGNFLWKVRANSQEIKTLAENTGATGGYLVPDAWSNTILKRSIERAIIRSLNPSIINMPGPKFDIPAIVSTSNASTFYGGVATYWGEESTNLEDGKSTPSFGKVSLDVAKLYGYTESYEDLIEDSMVALGPLLQQLFGDAIAFEEDYAFLNGNGVGKPLGVTSAPCRVTVSRATASQIHTTDIVGMLARFSGNLDNATFMTNQTTLPYIYTLQDAAGNYIWQPGMSGNISSRSPGSIYGVPLIVTEKCPALGTSGDLILGDWSNYLIGDLNGLRIEESRDFKFGADKRVWKIVKRVDGKPWLNSAITPRAGGSTLSPFVLIS